MSSHYTRQPIAEKWFMVNPLLPCQKPAHHSLVFLWVSVEDTHRVFSCSSSSGPLSLVAVIAKKEEVSGLSQQLLLSFPWMSLARRPSSATEEWQQKALNRRDSLKISKRVTMAASSSKSKGVRTFVIFKICQSKSYLKMKLSLWGWLDF